MALQAPLGLPCKILLTEPVTRAQSPSSTERSLRILSVSGTSVAPTFMNERWERISLWRSAFIAATVCEAILALPTPGREDNVGHRKKLQLVAYSLIGIIANTSTSLLTVWQYHVRVWRHHSIFKVQREALQRGAHVEARRS